MPQETTLYEKCPNTEFFLVQMRENTDQNKIPYLNTFHAVLGIYSHLLKKSLMEK